MNENKDEIEYYSASRAAIQAFGDIKHSDIKKYIMEAANIYFEVACIKLAYF